MTLNEFFRRQRFPKEEEERILTSSAWSLRAHSRASPEGFAPKGANVPAFLFVPNLFFLSLSFLVSDEYVFLI